MAAYYKILLCFHGFEEAFFCIIKSCRLCFLPNYFISEPISVAAYKVSSEGLRPEQENSGITLDNTLVLFPQWSERYLSVPLAPGCAIRQIAQDHVHRPIRYLLHEFQTVALHKFHFSNPLTRLISPPMQSPSTPGNRSQEDHRALSCAASVPRFRGAIDSRRDCSRPWLRCIHAAHQKRISGGTRSCASPADIVPYPDIRPDMGKVMTIVITRPFCQRRQNALPPHSTRIHDHFVGYNKMVILPSIARD